MTDAELLTVYDDAAPLPDDHLAGLCAVAAAVEAALAAAPQAEPVQEFASIPGTNVRVRLPVQEPVQELVQEQRERELNEALTERDDAEDCSTHGTVRTAAGSVRGARGAGGREMTRDDIIRMARQVRDGGHWNQLDIISFALLVAAAEREACAKVCEREAERWEGDDGPISAEARLCAIAIRERGEK